MISQINSKKESIIQKVMIYIFVLLIFIILANFAIRKYILYEYRYHNLVRLKEYQEIVKSIIVDIFKVNNILNYDMNSDYGSTLTKYSKNHIFASKYNLHHNNNANKVNLPCITLQELLVAIAKQKFIYLIQLNGQYIVTNGALNLNNCLTMQHYLTKDLACDVSIEIDPESHHEQQIISKIKNQIFFVDSCSVLAFLACSLILLYSLMKSQKVQLYMKQLQRNLTNSNERSNNIALFHRVNKEFTLKCYQYFKSNVYSNSSDITINDTNKQKYTNEYFPLPVGMMTQKDSITCYKISLSSLILDLKNYFQGYIAYYNFNVKLDIVSDVDIITVPFEYEIFNQIIISLLSNILHFNRSTDEERCIKLVLQEDLILCSSEGFSLDHNLLIRYSEKIFNDTANIYILNLGQIFVLLKNFGINYSVIRQHNSTIIKIKIDRKQSTDTSSLRDTNVIKLSQKEIK